MALTNTQCPPRPDDDNHLHLKTGMSLKIQEEPNDHQIGFRSRGMNRSFFLVRIARENSPERSQDAESVRWIVDIAGSTGDREDRDGL
jgi:hypothetical protein